MDGVISFEDLANKDLTLQKMIELTCGRPEVFVGDRSFRMVAAYLMGYDAAVGNLAGKAMLWNTDLIQFGRWLSKRILSFGTGRLDQRAWFVLIEEMYPDDETRLRQLPILFSEYISEQGQPGASV